MYGVSCCPTYMSPRLSKAIEIGFWSPEKVAIWFPVGLNSLTWLVESPRVLSSVT